MKKNLFKPRRLEGRPEYKGDDDFIVEIGLNEPREMTEEEIKHLEYHIKQHRKNRTFKQKMKIKWWILKFYFLKYFGREE